MERTKNPNFTRCFTLGATLVSQKQARALSKPCKAVIPSFPLLGMDSPCADELVALCNCMWQNQIQYFIMDWKKKERKKGHFPQIMLLSVAASSTLRYQTVLALFPPWTKTNQCFERVPL